MKRSLPILVLLGLLVGGILHVLTPTMPVQAQSEIFGGNVARDFTRSVTASPVGSGGQTNFISYFLAANPTGTTQQIGTSFTITGADLGSTACCVVFPSFRIAAYFGAETRSGGESMLVMNISGIHRLADPISQLVGIEMDIANNRFTPGAFPVAGQQVGGHSIVSTGSFPSDWGLTIGGVGKWQNAILIASGSLTASGNAIQYLGTGVSGTSACIGNNGSVYAGFCSPTLGNPGSVNIDNNRFLSALNAARAALITLASVDTANQVQLGSVSSVHTVMNTTPGAASPPASLVNGQWWVEIPSAPGNCLLRARANGATVTIATVAC